jgi:hypothetical protein
VGKYRAGAVSGVSFGVACFAILAGGPWSRFSQVGWQYLAGAALGGLIAFIAATVVHGRRDGSGGTTGALASVAFGWVAAIVAFMVAFACYLLALFILLITSSKVSG